jgi:DNA-binding CsgD family transcriptional regulator
MTSSDPRVTMAIEVTDLAAAGDRAYDELLDLAAEIVCRAMADICAIALLSDDRRKLHPLGLHHRDPVQRGELEAAGSLEWDAAGGVSEQVLATGRPAVFSSADLARAARDRPFVESFLNRPGVHSALIAAMRASGTCMGVVAVAQQSGSPALSGDDLPFVQGVADRLALAVENLRLREEIARLREPRRERLPDARLLELTARELEILKLIGEGLTSREIGERLYLSIRTVEWHRMHLSAKLGEHARSGLIALGRTLQE